MTGVGVEMWVEAAVLAVAATLALRVLLKRPVRREARSHPWLALAAAVLALTVVAGALFLFRASDGARRAIVAAVGLGTLAAVVHGRASYGTRRGLPPGSLGLATSLDAVDDPGFYAASARRWGPVFKMRQIHQPVACVTDPGLIHEVLGRDDDALAQSDWGFNRLVPGGYLEYMDGAAHERYRTLFAPAFTADVVAAARATVTEAARTQLRAMARDGERSAGGGGIHPEAYLLPVPQRALLAMVLGIRSDHPRFAELAQGFTDLNRPIELFLPPPRSSQDTFRLLLAAVRDRARELRDRPSRGPSGAGPDDPSASALGSLVAAAPDAIDDETAMGNLVLMVKEGTIMVRGLLRWLVKMLGDHPEWAVRMRESAADPGSLEALSVAFVDETIRLYESRYLYRRVVRPIEVGGHTVPAGWLLRLCLGEAHEDPTTFADPMRFDPGRFLPSRPGTDRFCPFGHGRHACLGAGPTRAIAAAFVREAALGYDVTVVDDGVAWRINRHWGLWRPSMRLHVVLTPAESPTR